MPQAATHTHATSVPTTPRGCGVAATSAVRSGVFRTATRHVRFVAVRSVGAVRLAVTLEFGIQALVTGGTGLLVLSGKSGGCDGSVVVLAAFGVSVGVVAVAVPVVVLATRRWRRGRGRGRGRGSWSWRGRGRGGGGGRRRRRRRRRRGMVVVVVAVVVVVVVVVEGMHVPFCVGHVVGETFANWACRLRRALAGIGSGLASAPAFQVPVAPAPSSSH